VRSILIWWVRIALAGVCFAAVPVWGQPALPPACLASFTEEKVREYASFLASDRMRGRDTPSAELDSCAAFLVARMKAAGLDASLQRFNLLHARLEEPNSLMVRKGGQTFVYGLRKDFVPVHLSDSGEVEAAVAFVGYGITAPEYAYDDYGAIDVAGKVVLLFTHEPQERDSASVFQGEQETEHSSLYQKVWNARAHGAVGALIVTDPNNHTFLRPANEWTPLAHRGSSSALVALEEREVGSMVVMRVGKRVAEELLAPSGHSLSGLQAKIDSALVPQSFVIPGVTVSMRAGVSCERLGTQNVVGILWGADPELKHQVVLVGAHYDHLGARGDTLIFNGADDNASGTAGLLAVAGAFAVAPARPRRSVVFCAFAGEEKGLYGSRYYVANPVLPLRRTVAMLNMDMIGRNDTAAVEVDGVSNAPWLREFVERAHEGVGLQLHFNTGKTAPSSDAMPFAWRRVAALTFTTGLHPDYHQPSDDVEKLALGHLVAVARLVFSTAWLLANEDLPLPAAAATGELPEDLTLPRSVGQ
jgi:hypothetical protein